MISSALSMKLKYKYLLFVVIIHLVFITLSLQFIKSNPYLFIVLELLIFISIGVSVVIYKQLVKPIQTLSAGIESMKDRDFSMKFRKIGHYEMDVLIDVYNQMIDTLREERLRHEEQHLLLDKLIKASPSGIIILDFDNRIDLINPAAENFLQVTGENVIGKPVQETAGIWGKTIEQTGLNETAVLTLSGLKIYRIQKAAFLDRGFKQHFVIIESLSEEIIKSERKSYENVIRMMSHEVNNSVGAVNSILNSCLQFYSSEEKNRADFENALQIAIRRNQHLNKFMSNFAEVVHIPEPGCKQCSYP